MARPATAAGSSSRSRPTTAGRTARRRRWRTTRSTSRPSSPGAKFDCNAPRNDSPYNTGLTTLPGSSGRTSGTRTCSSPHFPELEVEGPEGNGGIAPMGGPAYEPIKGNSSPFRFPNTTPGKPLFYEWTRDYIKDVRLNKQGRLEEIDRSRRSSTTRWTSSAGPDGALYVLEYGDGYFAENPDAQLSKINFVRGNRTPIAKVSANAGRRRGAAHGPVQQAGTDRPGRRHARLRVGLRGDGKIDCRAQHPAFTYQRERHYRPVLKVTDQHRAHRLGGRAGARRQPAAGGRADHDPEAGRSAAPFQFGRDDHLRGQGHRRHSRWTARRSPWPTSSATSATATRSPRRRAAPARSPCRWTRATPARRT